MSTAEPLNREQRQQQTRAALVSAARFVFARDGYHGASLDEIARAAGYSKGAVYSNFTNKAELFLAVLDDNLDVAGLEAWDPFAGEDLTCDDPPDGVSAAEVEQGSTAELKQEILEIGRGISLATLEFIAVAARDEDLSAALAVRTQLLVDFYSVMAARYRHEDDPLEPAEVGALLTALDQGSAVLWLSGLVSVDQGLVRTGLRRLVNPLRAADHPPGPSGGPGLLDPSMVQQWVDRVRAEEAEDTGR